MDYIKTKAIDLSGILNKDCDLPVYYYFFGIYKYKFFKAVFKALWYKNMKT